MISSKGSSTHLFKGRSLQTTEKPEAADEVLIPREKFDLTAIKRIIRNMNLKVTDQRVEILNSLTHGRAHVTAQEIFERVKRKDSDIGFATVYRFLRRLTDSGFVTEVRTRGHVTKYELASRVHHDHLTCTVCGKIVEFENHDIEELQNLVAYNNGFKLTGHVLELYGICETCQV